MSTQKQSPEDVLLKYFGYSSFREGQKDIIDHILNGQDIMAVMPTGAGKSICYQVPALIMSGITLVVSPLISLMKDQVQLLTSAGIRAAFINSSLSESQNRQVMELAVRGRYKLIYVAPERLLTDDFLDFCAHIDISMLTVDEAHCISQWGQDFRPSYAKIPDFIASLDKKPVLSAFTATATPIVRDDILHLLKLDHPWSIITGFDRPNLYYSVECPKNKNAALLAFLQKHSSERGIIYCSTRAHVEEVCSLLNENGFSALPYHAGLSPDARTRNQDDFIYDRVPFIVATNAFGMGIDKPDVRFVVHYNMPQSLESYYQEAGRAGRDGLNAYCLLLFSPQDVVIARFLLEQKTFDEHNPKKIAELQFQDQQRLRTMEKYCRTTGCLRNYILRYFGEKRSGSCGFCGNCDKVFEEKDVTLYARQIINCVAEVHGRYGMALITGILRGSSQKRLLEIGAPKLRTYGLLRDIGEEEVRAIIDTLIDKGYLVQTTDRYRVVRLGDFSPLKNPDEHVLLRINKDEPITPLKKKDLHVPSNNAQKRKPQRNSSLDKLSVDSSELFQVLRQLRFELAAKEGVPPYVIFNDRTLIEMSSSLPSDKEALLRISGVGEKKLARYGEIFLSRILQFMNNRSIKGDHQRTPAIHSAFATVSHSDSGDQKADTHVTPETQHDPYQIKCDDGNYYISDLAGKINEERILKGMAKITISKISSYLIEKGLLEIRQINGTNKKMPTPEGNTQGIIAVEKPSKSGRIFTYVEYPENIFQQVRNYFLKIEQVMVIT